MVFKFDMISSKKFHSLNTYGPILPFSSNLSSLMFNAVGSTVFCADLMSKCLTKLVEGMTLIINGTKLNSSLNFSSYTGSWLVVPIQSSTRSY